MAKKGQNYVQASNSITFMDEIFMIKWENAENGG